MIAIGEFFTPIANAVGMSHSVQDGRDAAARARATSSRPLPIRYDQDTWLVMRNDPVLPAAVILRLRADPQREFFIVVRWNLDAALRRMIGRYPSLLEADAAVLYDNQPPERGLPRP
jgi:hypothetical protein